MEWCSILTDADLRKDRQNTHTDSKKCIIIFVLELWTFCISYLVEGSRSFCFQGFRVQSHVVVLEPSTPPKFCLVRMKGNPS